ncbi:MAG: TetR/AcrR family transcriptional regulator [Erythrobacter sp.]|uniref:TetR/AcrR family transcriptional regulator n=1 Tax=Erythrobacter sp. TaxID=1042 RepID=UPI003267DCFB
MSQSNIAIVDALKAEAPSSDGRRARSQASRSKIIRAIMDLIEAGDPDPSTANVAKKAGVGLRSLFRHFEDKDAIYRELDSILMKAYRPVIEAPYSSDGWQDRLKEMIERRCEVNEATAPYRISTTAMRRRSKFLKENFQRLHDTEKARLNSILPSQLHTDTPLGRTILVAMSFDTWRMLREDEHLSAGETVEAVKQMAGDVIARLDD